MAHRIAKGAKVKKGERRPNSGRAKGTPNKFTIEAKEMVLESLQELGGVDYLKRMGEDYPKEYLALLSKLLPKAVDQHVTGDHQLVIISEFDTLDGPQELPPAEDDVKLISCESIEDDPDFQ